MPTAEVVSKISVTRVSVGLGDRLVDCEELPVEVPLPPSAVVYHPAGDGRLYEHTRLQSGELRVVDRQPVVYVLVAAPTEWYEIRERSIHATAGNVVDDDTLLSAAHVALLAERPQARTFGTLPAQSAIQPDDDDKISEYNRIQTHVVRVHIDMEQITLRLPADELEAIEGEADYSYNLSKPMTIQQAHNTRRQPATMQHSDSMLPSCRTEGFQSL